MLRLASHSGWLSELQLPWLESFYTSQVRAARDTLSRPHSPAPHVGSSCVEVLRGTHGPGALCVCETWSRCPESFPWGGTGCVCERERDTSTHTHSPGALRDTQTHTHTHTQSWCPEGHADTHLHTHTHTLVWKSTTLECPGLGSPLVWIRCTLSLPDSPPSSPSGFPFRGGAWGWGCIRNACHRDVLPTVRGNHLWSFMKTANPWVTP